MALRSFLVLLLVGCEASLYKLDNSFQPQWPQGALTFSGVGVTRFEDTRDRRGGLVFVTQRGNSSIAPVLVLNASSGAVVDSWGEDAVGLDRSKPSAPTWGSHGIAVEHCNYPCSPDTECQHPNSEWVRVWIDDFTNHTLTAFSPCGRQLLQLGTPGIAGNGTSPLQFGKVADSAVATGAVAPAPAPAPGPRPGPGPYLPTRVYSSDGDGGTANRVVAVRVSSGFEASVEWVTGHAYNNPHSIALHASGMLVIANREANQTRLLDAATGQDLGVWDCGLQLGAAGKPFGVRTLKTAEHDLVFVAIMDNPQDGKNQKIAVLDGSGLHRSEGARSSCKVLQVIQIDPEHSGPHLLGVDHTNGDLYAALVSDSPLSTVLRFELA